MKQLTVFILTVLISGIGFTSCSKKKKGVCYCDYFSGDKKELNLNSLSRDAQEDSCAQLNRNASGFGGECDLK